MDQLPNVVLGVITCRNPAGLEKLLRSLSEHDKSLFYRLVVVENDQAKDGMEVCERLNAAGFTPRIEVHFESRQGISYARNRVLTESRSEPFDYVAMLDDDEYPTQGWLHKLVRKARAEGADVVCGPVVGVLPTPPAPPLLESDFERPGWTQRGDRTLVLATGNVLFSAALVERHAGDWFAGSYALTGSEDSEFLLRTFSRGAKHAVEMDAVVYEDVPASRATEAWLRRRAHRTANGLFRIRAARQGRTLATMSEIVRIGGLLLMMAVGAVSRRDPRRRGLETSLRLARIRGKLDAIAGRTNEEYAPTAYR